VLIVTGIVKSNYIYNASQVFSISDESELLYIAFFSPWGREKRYLFATHTPRVRTGQLFSVTTMLKRSPLISIQFVINKFLSDKIYITCRRLQ